MTGENQQFSTRADEHYHPSGAQPTVEDGYYEEYAEKPAAPPRQRFYKKKKYWIICSIITIILIVVIVLLVLFVAFPKIAQSVMNHSGVDVESAQITFTPPHNLRKRDQAPDGNSTFYMDMKSKMTNTGPFSATISFDNPIEVQYNGNTLGYIDLPSTSVAAGSGQLDAFTAFKIKDQAQFASFAREMLAKPTFTWTLKGQAEITAMTRTAKVSLDKDIVLDGK
ncbi:hypothetical protein DFQ28_003659 [Apophysomyces sp. BC1034]|nr:hypothetical protein DFQ30_001816 [Apophysomyces sp. BC1015]KAG0182930.1 hypothetical protein DFQ29_001368 [Apophysomyces sp. BC1021]KAG0193739.1 hypothetical protein DFQ28_003659 [Apophysomyces sp. BC1034]